MLSGHILASPPSGKTPSLYLQLFINRLLVLININDAFAMAESNLVLLLKYSTKVEFQTAILFIFYVPYIHLTAEVTSYFGDKYCRI